MPMMKPYSHLSRRAVRFVFNSKHTFNLCFVRDADDAMCQRMDEIRNVKAKAKKNINNNFNI